MANELRNRTRRNSNGSGRNNATNAKRLDALKKSRGRFDTARIQTPSLLDAIGAAISNGGAIRIGLTRDGGALAIGVYVDGDSQTVYLNEDDDQNEFWHKIISVFEDPA